MSNPPLQTPERPSSQRPTEQRRRQRPKQTVPPQLAAGNRVLGPPVARAATAVLGANIPPRQARGRRVQAVELGVRGAHPRRTGAAPSGDLRRARHLQPDDLRPGEGSNMRKIDAFAHILPRSYLEWLERQLEKTIAPSRLDYYRQGVFSFDPVLTDLHA